VNPEFWIRGNLEHPHEKPHWFVDVLVVSMPLSRLREPIVKACQSQGGGTVCFRNDETMSALKFPDRQPATIR
jgi:hypothetical protein